LFHKYKARLTCKNMVHDWLSKVVHFGKMTEGKEEASYQVVGGFSVWQGALGPQQGLSVAERVGQ